MATKKAKTKSAEKENPDAFGIDLNQLTRSQALAELTTNSVQSALALKEYSSAGDDLKIPDLMGEMSKAAKEVVSGDMSRIERMLALQSLTLDAIFNNLVLRSGRQESLKSIEVMMRLALKAQAQARSTAETLALMKNPMPYIKQANIAHGHQQVNNGQTPTGAGNFKSAPNKLLEADHGERLEFGAQTEAGGTHKALETVGAVHRSSNT